MQHSKHTAARRDTDSYGDINDCSCYYRNCKDHLGAVGGAEMARGDDRWRHRALDVGTIGCPTQHFGRHHPYLQRWQASTAANTTGGDTAGDDQSSDDLSDLADLFYHTLLGAVDRAEMARANSRWRHRQSMLGAIGCPLLHSGKQTRQQ